MAASVRSKLFFALLILVVFATSCGQPAPATPTVDVVGTIVAATLRALTPQVPLETPTVAPILPAQTATATLTPAAVTTVPAQTGLPTITATPGTGVASGGVYGYPYGAVPRLIFIAFNQENGRWNYLINVAGSSYYSMDLPEGKYQIVAYDAAGHAGGCTTIVTVKDKQTANCDVTDWTGSYPAKPDDAPKP